MNRRLKHFLIIAFAFLGSVSVVLILPQTLRFNRIRSRSMSPTLIPGDCVLSIRQLGSQDVLHRGQVVIFLAPLHPKSPFMQRIIALPGDRVELIDGHLAVNGTLLKSPAGLNASQPTPFKPLPPGCRQISYPLTVPDSQVFVLGDNYANCVDSRYFGPIPADLITHAHTWIVSPYGRFGKLD